MNKIFKTFIFAGLISIVGSSVFAMEEGENLGQNAATKVINPSEESIKDGSVSLNILNAIISEYGVGPTLPVSERMIFFSICFNSIDPCFKSVALISAREYLEKIDMKIKNLENELKQIDDYTKSRNSGNLVYNKQGEAMICIKPLEDQLFCRNTWVSRKEYLEKLEASIVKKESIKQYLNALIEWLEANQ